MKTLEVKVAQPLRISSTGVDQYMQVDASNLGRVTILPAPTYAGMYAQLCATPGEKVKMASLGKASKLNWGILLDARMNQYGHPMVYDAGKMGTVAQVFYVGDGKHFPRSNLHAGRLISKSKSSVDVELFGGDVIPVRYSGWNQDATIEDLNAFQGFVVTTQPGKKSNYRIWFELTADNFKAACEDKRYEGIHGMIAFDEFSILSSGDHFTVSGLEDALAKREEAAAPKKKKDTKYATLKLESDDRTIEVRVEVGTYGAEQLFLTKAQARTHGRGKLKGSAKKDYAVLTRFYGHLTGNNPLTLDGNEVHKTQQLTFESDRTYVMKMVAVHKEQAPTQPVYKKPEEPKPNEPVGPIAPSVQTPAPTQQASAQGTRAERRQASHAAQGRSPAPQPTPQPAPRAPAPSATSAPRAPQPAAQSTPPPAPKKKAWKERSTSRPAREETKTRYRSAASGS